MAYETSYDVGLKPISHDKHRGKWASPKDFFFACIGHAFKVDAIFVLPSIILRDTGFYGLALYAITVMVCTIPIVYMQTFLGQFSSTGFISVFRIAPICKGVGYVSLAVNLVTLTYYSIFAAIPLFYFFHAMNPTLPWGCNHDANWMSNFGNGTIMCHIVKNEMIDLTYLQLPSQKLFTDHMNPSISLRGDNLTNTYSWLLFACTIVIWISVWAILRNPMEMVGRIIRYLATSMIVALGICVVRFAFLPGAFRPTDYFKLRMLRPTEVDALFKVPVMALSGLGPGWGSILSMASYNNFKTNVTQYTWVLCLGQAALMIASGLALVFIENFLIGERRLMAGRRKKSQNSFVICSSKRGHVYPSRSGPLDASLGGSNSVDFYGTATSLDTALLWNDDIGGFKSFVLTSLFDEYVPLRRMRREVVVALVGGLCLISFLFCSNEGILAFELLCKYSILTQILLNLMLLLVVLWIYGRERFQRDVYFMTNRTYSTWMVNIVRFVAPLFLLLSFLVGLIFVCLDRSSRTMFAIISLIMVVPWLLIPGYCIFKLTQTMGMLRTRFRRCCRPTDWYPAEPDDKQRYDEAFNEPEINHQLAASEEDV